MGHKIQVINNAPLMACITQLGNYFVIEDLLITFRASSDLIKCLWLLSPALTLAVTTISLLLFRRYWRQPVVTVHNSDLGVITIYHKIDNLKSLYKMTATIPKLGIDRNSLENLTKNEDTPLE